MEHQEGYKKTKIGWIPEDWNAVKIGTAVNKIVGGGTPSRERLDYYDGDIPWITVKDLSKNSFYKDSAIESISEEGLKNSSANLIDENNIIIATRMGLGRGFINTCELAINQDMKALYLDKNILSNEFFLSWYLNNSDFIESLGTGTTVKGISLTTVKNLSLPIPPLPEQKKIASILTTVDDKISSIDQQIQQTEQLKKGLMEKLLTEGIGHTEFKETKIGRVPKGWGVQLIGTLCDLTSGGTPSRKNDEYWGGDIPWVKTGEIQYNTIVSTEETITEKGIKNSAAKIVPKNSILMAMYGQGKTRGKVAVLGVEASLNQACLAIICNERVNSTFLFQYFSSNYDRIRSLSQEGSQKNLSATLVRNIKVPVPPLEEQKQIASILSTVDDKIDILNQKKSHYQTLKKGLSQQLLTGQMRVKI